MIKSVDNWWKKTMTVIWTFSVVLIYRKYCSHCSPLIRVNFSLLLHDMSGSKIFQTGRISTSNGRSLGILYLITSSFGGYQVTHHEAWGWYPPKPKAEGDTTPQAETYVHAVVLNSNSTEKLYLKLKQINNTIRQSTIRYILLVYYCCHWILSRVLPIRKRKNI